MGVARKIEVVEPVRAKRLPLSLSLLHGGQHGAANADAEGGELRNVYAERARTSRSLDAAEFDKAIANCGITAAVIATRWLGVTPTHLSRMRRGDVPIEPKHVRRLPPSARREMGDYLSAMLAMVECEGAVDDGKFMRLIEKRRSEE